MRTYFQRFFAVLLLACAMLFLAWPVLAAPTIDGDGSDWTTYDTIVQDDVGDSNCEEGTDIKEYYLYVEGDYLYVMLKVEGAAVHSDVTLESYIDYTDGQEFNWLANADIGMNFHMNGGNPWISAWKSTGGVDVSSYEIALGSVIEAKIPLSVFGNPSYFKLEYCKTWITHYSDVCDELYGTDMISWMYVQRRSYEDGTRVNRCNFGVRMKSGGYYTTDPVSNITLKNPLGNEVTLSECQFYKVYTMSGSYDSGSGSWSYGSDFYFESGNACKFDETIQNGVYGLQVLLNDGKTLNREFTFNGLVDLPVATADEFSYSMNAQGLSWNYEVPAGIDPSWDVSARAIIEGFQNDSYLAEIYVKIPVDLGFVFVPKSIIQSLKARGANKLRLTLQIRTNDNNNRSYSDHAMYNLSRLATQSLILLLFE